MIAVDHRLAEAPGGDGKCSGAIALETPALGIKVPQVTRINMEMS